MKKVFLRNACLLPVFLLALASVAFAQVGQCFDNDEANSVYVKGELALSSSFAIDYYTDACVNVGSVREYFCSGYTFETVDKPCPSGYSCSSGACVSSGTSSGSSSASASCIDSDSGQDVSVKGITVGSGSASSDSCIDASSLTEYFCMAVGSTSVKTSITKTCPAGSACSDGACVETCTDSDGGTDIAVKGTTITGSDSSTDSCVSGKVREYYCDMRASSAGAKRSVDRSCSSGQECKDGACVAVETAPAAPTCRDSDNGEDIYTFGTATRYSADGSVLASVSDRCYSSEKLFEETCLSDGALNSVDKTCPSGYVCDGGACIARAQSTTCLETDGGVQAYVKGSVTLGSEVKTDYCPDASTIIEYYCTSVENGRIESRQYPVPSGYSCVDGAFSQQSGSSGGTGTETPAASTSTCKDSDNGINVYTPGRVEASLSVARDSCVTSTTVKEYYCRDGKLDSIDSECPSGYSCDGGACVSLGTSTQSSCVDSENGIDIYSFGTARDAATTASDSCDGEFTVRDYYCYQGQIGFVVQDCPSGYSCSSGACVAPSSGSSSTPTAETVACRDSDSGTDIYVAGKVSYKNEVFADECVDSSLLREYYCDSRMVNRGGSAVMRRVDRNCPDDFVCRDGACVKFAEQKPKSDCRETDGGDDVSKKGTSWSSSEKGEDYCLGDDSLIEYFCAKSDSGVAVRKDKRGCERGFVCRDGACVSPSASGERSCKDSDGGYVKELKGETIVYNSDQTIVERKEDYCYSESQVVEYFCEKDSVKAKHEACLDGYSCVDGACVSSSTTPQSATGSTATPAPTPSTSTATTATVPPIAATLFTARLAAGWNMFSVPFDSVSVDSDCENFAAERAWTYDAVQKNYVRPSSFEPGQGYWFKATSACSVKIAGRKTFEMSGKKLRAGWNQIGSQSRNINIRELMGDCVLLKGPWQWNEESQKWQKAAEMQPGEAYFVKVESECTLGGSEIPPLPE
ncbi:hypothetical protein HY992_01005 [Candidatus Micrarchaeota archaeon]|nr:hypothetical protein [Candidatus Micrarchaeota archaeon]